MNFEQLIIERYPEFNKLNMVPIELGLLKGSIKEVTAISKNYPTGQKVIAAIAEYDCDIKAESVSKDCFAIVDSLEIARFSSKATAANGGVSYSWRNIVRAYVNNKPELDERGRNGRFVIIELDSSDESADTFCYVGAHRKCVCVVRNIELIFMQTKEIRDIDGDGLAACMVKPSTKIRHQIVDDFTKGEFRGLKFNLYVPKNYDPSKKYPLVHFVGDSWEVGPQHEISLMQGNGGVVWATPEEQAKRPCFVLVPQFDWPTIVEDDYSVSPRLETDKELLDSIVNCYSIARDRIYATGQSMGTLSALELNIRYPNLFAGSLLFSGFWNPKTVKNLYKHNIWLISSEGDRHSVDVDRQCMKKLKEMGAEIDTEKWDGRQPLDKLEELAHELAARPSNIKWTIFDKDSVVPENYIADGGSNHRCTWQLGYQIEAFKEWLFKQRKQ